MICLDNFNDAQKEAITSSNAYIKVIAGAGSGKTAVLTNRIAYLIKERKVDERKIVAITFTNKAAKEMKERVEKLLDIEAFKGIISTFHSFCLRILKEDINRLGYKRNFNIVDVIDQKKIIKDINKKLNYDNDVYHSNNILSYISNKKNNYHLDYYDDYLSKIYDVFYDEYQRFLKDNNSLDFDDLLLLAVKLLKEDKIILDKWRYRFNYYLVDEFQDTNKLQYDLIKLLASDLNLFVVGDPDQNIYSWRGARIDYILNFNKDFKPSKEIILDYNYRSSEHILNVANSLISNNSTRVDKSLKATIKNGEDVKVIHYIGRYDSDEAEYVINRINELKDNNVSLNDIAILYRSNYISRVFESNLVNNDIPYRIYGGTKFFERREIKDLLAYLKVINSQDNLSLARIINVPKRGIGETSLNRIIDNAQTMNTSYFDFIDRNMDVLKLNARQKEQLYDLISYLKTDFKYSNVGALLSQITIKYNVLENDHDKLDYQARDENIQELIRYASTFEKLDDFLMATSLELSLEENNDSQECINLMTLHSAKGLEYKYVFVVFLCDGIFPSKYALETLDLEEERRLAYVGFTRAKEQLFLLSHNTSYNYDILSSSTFIKEIDSDLLNKEGYYQRDNYLELEVDNKSIFNAKNKEVNADFKVNDIVEHASFKKGIVIAIDDNILTIAFEQKVGIKKIVKDFVKKHDN